MVDRGLLYREWKQNQVVIVLSIVFLVLANPLSIVNTYLSYQGCLDRQDPQYCDFIVNYSISNLIDINWVPVSFWRSAFWEWNVRKARWILY